MEWVTPRGLENRAFAIADSGRVLGHQTKNQITPGGEERHYVPDAKRAVFDLAGVRVGIVICHEGWRYPETVRWAAVRGAKIVFQPQVTGSDPDGPVRAAPWGTGFYEMAMVCRAQENSIYFASVNQAMTRQNSATALIDPKGDLVAHVPRGEESLLVADLDLAKATGFYAGRYKEPR
jgi:predicted amidohydrolase